MYTLTLKDENNNELVFNDLGGAYKITDIKGLSPAKATINTNQAAFMDGATFNSSKVGMRTINMAFTIEEPVETNRIAVYRVLRTKKPITLYYTSNLLDVFIEGYVESVDIGHFDKKQKATVSILCTAPYFKKAQEQVNEMSAVENMFHFPFYNEVGTENIVFGRATDTEKAIVNNGGIETGLIIELYARDEVENPKVYDYATSEYIGVDFTMQAGDLIIINTVKGQKSINLWRDGVLTNIFNYLAKGSTWLQLAPNGSVYVYTIDEGLLSNLYIDIKHYDLYEGV